MKIITKLFGIYIYSFYLCPKLWGMKEVELEFLDWVSKVNEKITFILLNIKNRNDIKEEDYDLLKVFHKIHFCGEMPYYKTQMDGVSQTVTQPSLFTDIPSENVFNYSNGTEIVHTEEVTLT